MLICSECGKTIANTNPKVHHGVCASCNIPEEVYTKPQIKEAVDIAIGDDGFRSKEVLEILKVDNEPVQVHDTLGDIHNIKIDNDRHGVDLLKLFESIDILNQGLINLDAKYKRKTNKLFKLIEAKLALLRKDLMEMKPKPGPVLVPKEDK